MKFGRAAALFLLLALAGCEGVQSALDPDAYQAERIDEIWRLMLWVCAFMYLLVLAFLGWALWRGRRRFGPELVDPLHSPHEKRLHVTMGGWIGLILAGLTVLTAGSFFVDRQLAHASVRDPVRITITANQFWWDVRYDFAEPDQMVHTANELHLPVGRPAEILLRSNDVIHSFWVPNLNGKQDLIPGRDNEIFITPKRVGVYRGQCAEFCGLQHAHMALDVTIDSRVDFERWLEHQRTLAPEPVAGPAAEGLYVFESKACAACHTVAGTQANGQVGPNLTHLASRRSIGAGALPYNRGALAAWIADTQGVKPGSNMPTVELSPEQLNALVAYLETLK